MDQTSGRHTLPAAERDARIAFARECGYDVCKCARAWGLTIAGAHSFAIKNGIHLLNKEGPGRDWQHKKVKKAWPVLQKPEYENQPLLDLQVLTREEYMEKYRLPSLASYACLLCRVEKKHGFIATPERRQKWIEEDERKEFAEDHTAAECGKEWGLSGKVAWAWCRKHGVKPKSRRLPPDLPERMIGMTVAEAKAAFFPDSTGIYVFMHKNGLYVRGRNKEIYRK